MALRLQDPNGMNSVLQIIGKALSSPVIRRIFRRFQPRTLQPVPTCGLHVKPAAFQPFQPQRQYRAVLQHLDPHHVGALRAQSAGGPTLRWQFHRSDTGMR